MLENHLVVNIGEGVMSDVGEFRVCSGDFVELGKNKRRNERYDRRSQLRSCL